MATEATQHTIDTLFLEERRYPPDPEFARQANAQPDICDRDFEEFWETEGRERVTWFGQFDKLLEWDSGPGSEAALTGCFPHKVLVGFGKRVLDVCSPAGG